MAETPGQRSESAGKVRFRCACGQRIGVPAAYAGRKVKCPRCGRPSVVPALETRRGEPASDVATAENARGLREALRATPSVEPPAPRSVEAPAPPDDSEPVVMGRTGHDFSSVFSERAPAWTPSEPGSEGISTHADQLDSHASQTDGPGGDHHALNESPDVVTEPAVESELMDRPRVRRRETRSDSSAEVENLIRDMSAPAAGSQESAAGHPRPTAARAQSAGGEAAISRAIQPTLAETAAPAPHAKGVSYAGLIAITLGAAAIAACLAPRLAWLAVPIGAAGLVLGLIGVVRAATTRRTASTLPLGGAVASAIAVAVSVAGARGWIPLPGRSRALAPTRLVTLNPNAPADGAPADGYVPATSPVRVGDVVVRVASVMLVQPAVHDEKWNVYQTLPDKRLQVTVELANLAASGRRLYRTWGVRPADGPQPMMTDEQGGAIRQDDVSPLIPAGRCPSPASLTAGDPATSDVILFVRPEKLAGDLKLDLPGANLGLPDLTLRFRIPAGMVQQ